MRGGNDAKNGNNMKNDEIIHERADRVREDAWHKGMVQVKVWVTHLPVDYSYGASGPDHDQYQEYSKGREWKTDRCATAQRCAYVPGGMIDAGVAAAYAQLLDEYQEEETTEEGEQYVFNRFGLPDTVEVLEAFRREGRPLGKKFRI